MAGVEEGRAVRLVVVGGREGSVVAYAVVREVVDKGVGVSAEELDAGVVAEAVAVSGSVPLRLSEEAKVVSFAAESGEWQQEK